ncbi:MAG: hypothetical protein Ct9H90mP2_02510 [Dehalococcoidia bacterium]|nr:MAG: hypothetical protein Ct9H90mP2_02510 [Dehalococcoidia bacterium]
MSRAIGETAPILIISSLVFITMVPSGPMDRFTYFPYKYILGLLSLKMILEL